MPKRGHGNRERTRSRVLKRYDRISQKYPGSKRANPGNRVRCVSTALTTVPLAENNLPQKKEAAVHHCVALWSGDQAVVITPYRKKTPAEIHKGFGLNRKVATIKETLCPEQVPTKDPDRVKLSIPDLVKGWRGEQLAVLIAGIELSDQQWDRISFYVDNGPPPVPRGINTPQIKPIVLPFSAEELKRRVSNMPPLPSPADNAPVKRSALALANKKRFVPIAESRREVWQDEVVKKMNFDIPDLRSRIAYMFVFFGLFFSPGVYATSISLFSAFEQVGTSVRSAIIGVFCLLVAAVFLVFIGDYFRELKEKNEHRAILRPLFSEMPESSNSPSDPKEKSKKAEDKKPPDESGGNHCKRFFSNAFKFVPQVFGCDKGGEPVEGIAQGT